MSEVPPKLHELTLLDLGTRRIEAAIAILGSSSRVYMRCVHERTSETREVIDTSVPGEPSVGYLALTLGEIRGFTTRFHLYALDPDPGLVSTLEAMLPYLRAIIIAEPRTELGPLVPLAAMAATMRTIPVATMGPDALAARWSELTGAAPTFSGPMDGDTVFPALKAVAREVLAMLKSP